MLLLERIAKNDFFILARFVVPLCFTDVTVDIAEQVYIRVYRLHMQAHRGVDST